jgi:hypothetical protein
MEISNIEFFPIQPRSGLIGFTSMALDHVLKIDGIAVYTRPNGGIRLVFPDRCLPNGLKVNLIKPLDHSLGLALEDAVQKVVTRLQKPNPKRSAHHE